MVAYKNALRHDHNTLSMHVFYRYTQFQTFISHENISTIPVMFMINYLYQSKLSTSYYKSYLYWVNLKLYITIGNHMSASINIRTLSHISYMLQNISQRCIMHCTTSIWTLNSMTVTANHRNFISVLYTWFNEGGVATL